MTVTRKLLVSLFCALNLATVVYSNRPAWLAALGARATQGVLGADGAAWVTWLVGRHAHLSGLQPRWALFGPLPPKDSAWIIAAYRRDGTALTLPSPPWARGDALDLFLEHKHSKFELNLTSDSLYRLPFGRYLCRTVDVGGGERPVSVALLQVRAPVLPHAETASRGVVLGPAEPTELTESVSCEGAARGGAS